MRDSLEAFEKTLESINSNWNLQNNLVDLIENLNKNLESERETTTKLQEQIQSLMKQDNFGITSKYVALKVILFPTHMRVLKSFGSWPNI
ncbi:hypothetical protein TcasGA2_TC033283 [Tribolium castaneum]|uniref:Uncharacterized protein n=1 Tax=Tribolium castaneum TaxID=7070 RepID=A0A139WA57_TRICA|nr:hypothetical protein TcasGA2_TC033283 [Tribolium castaneum]